MEEVKNASVSINLNDGSIIITGSETFIEKNMGFVFTYVEKNKTPVATNALTQPTSHTPKPLHRLKVKRPFQVAKQAIKISIRNWAFIVLMLKMEQSLFIERFQAQLKPTK